MKHLLGKRFSLAARLNARKNVSGSAKSRRVTLFLTLPLVAGLLFATSSARADDYSFSINGSGITASGVIWVTNTGPFGAYTVTNISGNFSDSNNGFSGAITGLNPAGPPLLDFTDTYFSAPAVLSSGLSYDNLFWPGGNSPAVCVDASIFSGGDFDIYGLSFTVAGGYAVDLWSNGPGLGGYQLADVDPNGALYITPDPMAGTAYAVDFAATPEPGSLLLLGSGMAGALALLRRRRAA